MGHPSKPNVRRCDVCGREYEYVYANSKYCSQACRNKAKWQLAKAKRGMEHFCEVRRKCDQRTSANAERAVSALSEDVRDRLRGLLFGDGSPMETATIVDDNLDALA